jgi:hypothetical protein
MRSCHQPASCFDTLYCPARLNNESGACQMNPIDKHPELNE